MFIEPLHSPWCRTGRTSPRRRRGVDDSRSGSEADQGKQGDFACVRRRVDTHTARRRASRTVTTPFSDATTVAPPARVVTGRPSTRVEPRSPCPRVGSHRHRRPGHGERAGPSTSRGPGPCIRPSPPRWPTGRSRSRSRCCAGAGRCPSCGPRSATPERHAGHLTTGIFGAPRTGFYFTDLRPPDDIRPAVGLPDSFATPRRRACPAFEPMPFWAELVEGRPAIGHAPWEDYVPDRAERAMWYRFDESPVLDDGRLDPLALIVLADTMPGAVGEKVGPSDRSWFAPSIDLTLPSSRPLPLVVGPGPQPGPVRRRRLCLGRHGPVGLR